MSSGFPVHERRRINAQLRGHLPLRQAEAFARGSKALGNGIGWRLWVVSQESDDARHVAGLWDGCVALPTGNRHLVNANLFSYLFLEEFQAETAGADVVA